MYKIAALIPCYNESKTIGKVIDDLTKTQDIKIYVYDNNSTDDTALKVLEKQKVYDNVFLCHEYKQGKGNVIRRMFREIDADVYVLVDGDDTYILDNLKEMIELVKSKKADMVIGDRLSGSYFTENKRPFHNFGNKLVKNAINLIYKSDISDVMTGFRVMNRTFVKTFPVLSKGFDIETEMTIHSLDKGFLLKNITVGYKDRVEGSHSKLNTVTDGIKVIITILRMFMQYKPFNFFFAIFMIFEIVAIIFFCPILDVYIKTGLVPRFPTLFASLFVSLVGLQFLSIGIILQNLRYKELQEFEYRLIDVETGNLS